MAQDGCAEVRVRLGEERPCCVVCHERGGLHSMVLDGRVIQVCCTIMTLAVTTSQPGRLTFDLDSLLSP